MCSSRSFAEVQLHRSIVEKEAYAIVATCRKVDYLLHRQAFSIYTPPIEVSAMFQFKRVVATILKYKEDKLRRCATSLITSITESRTFSGRIKCGRIYYLDRDILLLR